jgi:release factor glutamine methyltransferase
LKTLELSRRDELVKFLRKELEPLESAHEAAWIADYSLLKNSKMAEGIALAIVERRKSGEPLAYILGSWAFRSHEFLVGRGVLIPRPETEELLDYAHAVAPMSGPLTVVDFGAGSGCLGISFMAEWLARAPARKGRLILIERSEEARKWLQKNVHAFKSRLAKADVEIVPLSWVDWKAEAFHLGLANPPYVTEKEFLETDDSVKAFEPRSALVPDDTSQFPDASGPYRQILALARKSLNPGCWLWCEIGPAQVKWIVEYAEQSGDFSEVRLLKDMAGKLRHFGVKRNG